MAEYDEAVSALWAETKTDWSLELRTTLTEPVCCIVSLTPENDEFPTITDFIGVGDMAESVLLACCEVLKRLEVKGTGND